MDEMLHTSLPQKKRPRNQQELGGIILITLAAKVYNALLLNRSWLVLGNFLKELKWFSEKSIHISDSDYTLNHRTMYKKSRGKTFDSIYREKMEK